MPTKRRRPKGRRDQITAVAWAVLTDQPPPPDAASQFEAFILSNPDLWLPGTELHRLWRLYAAEIIEKWAVARPGTRPRAWWAFSAPRWPAGQFKGFWFDGCLPLPRERLGGRGRPAHEVDATFPESRAGLPVHWHTISRRDPPRFESQATYLQRLGLLLPGEARRLSDRDFEPEIVSADGAR